MFLGGRFTASFFLLLASISYGSLGIVAKFAYADGVKPISLALSQMFFGLLFFVILKVGKTKTFFSLRKQSVALLFVGGFMSALTAYFYYQALSLLNASVAIVMLFQFVWIGLVLELVRQKRAPTKMEIASVLLCYIGTYLSVGFDTENMNFYGLFIGFLSGIFFAVYIYASSYFCIFEKSDTRAFWTIFSAFLSLLLLAWMDIDVSNLLKTLQWGVLCGILGVLLPFYIYAVFSPRIGAAATSLIGSAELPSALVLSALILKENLSVSQIIGSFAVILAVVTVFISGAKAK